MKSAERALSGRSPKKWRRFGEIEGGSAIIDEHGGLQRDEILEKRPGRDVYAPERASARVSEWGCFNRGRVQVIPSCGAGEREKYEGLRPRRALVCPLQFLRDVPGRALTRAQ